MAAFCLLMTIGLAVFLMMYRTPAIGQLTFTEQICGMEIKPFYDEVDDIYYLFLPAYVSKEQVEIAMPEDASIHFSANGQDYGSSLAHLPLQEPVELSISAPHCPSEKCTIELLQSKNIPTLFIETGEGGIEFIRLNKANKTQAAVMAVNADGDIDYSGMCSFAGRGNTTFGKDKMPYNLKFSQGVSLIVNADSTDRWCLLANYGDDSQLRNALCYYVADSINIPYTSGTDYVSLYINGVYNGLYMLGTKYKYQADAGNKVTAVFERTRFDRPYDKITDYGFHLRIRYGNTEETYKTLNKFESVLFNGGTYQQLEQYADMNAMARKFFVDAVCANYDLKLSQYYMVRDDGKIAPICAWDYDNSFGLCPQYPDFAYNQIPISYPWYNKFFEYKEFRHALLTLMQEYQSFLRYTFLGHLDSLSTTLESDWNANAIRWKGYASMWKDQKMPKCKDCDFSTIHGHQLYIADYMSKRLDFLQEYWSAPEKYCRLMFDNESIRQLGNTITLLYHKGDTLTEDMLPDGLLTMPDEGFVGWYTWDGTSVTDVGVVTQDMSFDERITPKSHTTALWEKALHKAWLLILIAVFGCLVLWLFIKAVIIPIKEARK